MRVHLLEGELQPSTSTLMFGGKTLKFGLKLHICYVQRKVEPYGFKFATETGFQVASVLQDSTFAATSVVLLGLGGPVSPGPVMVWVGWVPGSASPQRRSHQLR